MGFRGHEWRKGHEWRERPIGLDVLTETFAGGHDRQLFAGSTDLLLRESVVGHEALGILPGQRAGTQDAAQCFGRIVVVRLVIALDPFHLGEDFPCAAFDGVAPQHAGCFQPITDDGCLDGVRAPAMVGTDVRLRTSQDTDIRILLLGGH
ncbi:hypothetical protein D9M70_438380 [compost metagenome]